MSDWLLISDWLIEFWSTNWLLINSDWLIDYWLINVSSDRPIEFWLINWFLIDQLIADLEESVSVKVQWKLLC